MGTALTRIEAKPMGDIDEAWVQRLIFAHPEILPVSEFDEAAGDLIPIARELPTDAGHAIDDFFVSPNGSLVVVETKLWKNPEKHRTVVAQVIDYAQQMAQWSYDKLDDMVKRCTLKPGSLPQGASLTDIVTPYLGAAGIEIDQFQERVAQRLRKGQFILLIVGDRISANVALMVDWLSSAPGLDFRLGLVEIQLYPLSNDSKWSLLAIPDIVGRTVEKTRGVVKVSYQKEEPKAVVEYAETDSSEPSRDKTTQDEFLGRVPSEIAPVYERWFDRWLKQGYIVFWGVSGFSVRFVREGRKYTILDCYPEWASSVIRKVDAERLTIPPDIYQSYVDRVRAIPSASAILAGGKRYIRMGEINPDELEALFNASISTVDSILKIS